MEISISEIILITITVALVIAVIATVLYIKINQYLDTNVRLAIYGDLPMSIKNNSMFLNFVNIKPDSPFLEVAEDDLKMFAMGTPIDAVFYKSATVPNGLVINYNPMSLSNMQFISMMGAIKYNNFEMSYDRGETRIKVNSVGDKVAKSISNRMKEMRSFDANELRSELVSEINNSGIDRVRTDLSDEKVISHINERNTTGTTMRFQAIIPRNHFIHKMGFDPTDPTKSKFYYVYEGKLYNIQSRFVESVENFYEWDLFGLEPGKIYVGLSFSVDGGKNILPSEAMYGLTKNKNGSLPTIDESELGKPTGGEEAEDMWTEEAAVKYLGEKKANKNYDVIVKKHYEDDYTEQYLALSSARGFHDEYNWLKTPEQTGETKLEDNKEE